MGMKFTEDQQRVIDLRNCNILVSAAAGSGWASGWPEVSAGGSGCGCGASVLCGYLLDRLEKRELRRLLFCATGALLSPTSSWQGESIPGVCHAVAITAEGV